jgi:signal transduction histidine kinase
MVAVGAASRSTQTLMSVEQSGASSRTPPRGTVCVTSWTPVKVVLALSQETVANGSRKQRAINAKSDGESQRRSRSRTVMPVSVGLASSVRKRAGPELSSGCAWIGSARSFGARPLFSAGRLWDHLLVPHSLAFPGHGAEGVVAARDSARWRRGAALLLSAAAVGLGVAAYRVQVQNLSPRSWAAAWVAVAWAFVLAGLLAWLRRPANRLGPLMLAGGLALAARQLRYSHDAAVFTVFFLLGDLGFALVGHSILAYPSGRVSGRFSRLLVKAGYATMIVFPLAVLLLHGQHGGLLGMGPVARRSLLILSDRPHAAELLQKTQTAVFYGVLATLVLGVIAHRLVRATPRARRMLAPLLLAAVALVLRAIFENVHTFVTKQPFAFSYLFWWQIAAAFALALAMLVGMLRSRLAHVNVSGLVVELERISATPASVRDALARALADPSLELFFWLPEQNAFVDAAGAAVSLPDGSLRRAVTRLEHDGEPLAAIVYDPSLLEEPELVEAAGAAARLALENARLHAQTRAQLQQVRESRRRIVSAADEERRRIERNLHDGAQQRLLALALQLSKAQRHLGELADSDVERLLAASVEELQSTVEELRTLARGLHPTVLTEYGLATALQALTHKSSVTVTLDVCEERLPAPVEAAAYFVASEALTNVVKHAHAVSASITVRRETNRLIVEIGDDGVGGAKASDGSGLQGMADRVEALDGQLRIRTGATGTRVTAEIPCAS